MFQGVHRKSFHQVACQRESLADFRRWNMALSVEQGSRNGLRGWWGFRHCECWEWHEFEPRKLPAGCLLTTGGICGECPAWNPGRQGPL